MESQRVTTFQSQTESFFRITPFSSLADDNSTSTKDDDVIRLPVPKREGPLLVFHPTTDVYNGREKLPEAKYENIELDEDAHWDERLHCFNGLLPLDHIVTAVNILVMVISICGVCLSCARIHIGSRGLTGVRSLQHMLVSSGLMLPIFGVPLGFYLLLCGSFGLYLNISGNRHGFGSYVQVRNARRRIDVSYHSGMYLCSLLSAVYFLGTVLVLVYASRDNGVYTSKIWNRLIHSHPLFHCQLEQRLNCASQCATRPKPFRFANCPGVFCVEFCRVGPNIPFNESSVHPICRPCREPGPRFRKFFRKCQQLELEIDRQRDMQLEGVSNESVVENIDLGCERLASSDLIKASIHSVIIATLYFACIITLNMLSCYRLCYF